MPKKKLSNRMPEAKRKKLYAELARYKSGAPINAMAKRFGVSTGTVNHWWKKVKANRKRVASVTQTRAVNSFLADSIVGIDFGPQKTQPHIDIEALIRDEARKYLDEAFRKA
jgi:hypothetical protein